MRRVCQCFCYRRLIGPKSPAGKTVFSRFQNQFPTGEQPHMATATTTATDTGQQTPTRGRQREAQQPVTQQERSAAQRLRTTMAAVKLAFTWLGVRKTLAPRAAHDGSPIVPCRPATAFGCQVERIDNVKQVPAPAHPGRIFSGAAYGSR